MGAMLQTVNLSGGENEQSYTLEQVSERVTAVVVQQKMYKGFLLGIKHQVITDNLSESGYEVTAAQWMRINHGIGKYLFNTLQKDLVAQLVPTILSVLKDYNHNEIIAIFGALPAYLVNPKEFNPQQKKLYKGFLERVKKEFGAHREELRRRFMELGEKTLELNFYRTAIYSILRPKDELVPDLLKDD